MFTSPIDIIIRDWLANTNSSLQHSNRKGRTGIIYYNILPQALKAISAVTITNTITNTNIIKTTVSAVLQQRDLYMANIVPINKELHQNTKVSAKRDLSHVANQHIVPVTAAEFSQAASSFPVVFVKAPEAERYRSVVMLGLESGENLFYSEEKWKAIFLPQSVAMIPFSLGLDPEKEKTLTSCIDVDSPFVGEDKDNALFKEDGSETEFLTKIQESLGRLYENEVASEKFVKEITDNNLLQELEINLTFANGEQKKLVGIYTINDKKLQTLTEEQVLSFHKRGMFIPLHAMLGSVSQMNRLIQLRNETSDRKITGIKIQPVTTEPIATI
jgi:hypothetical protein